MMPNHSKSEAMRRVRRAMQTVYQLAFVALLLVTLAPLARADRVRLTDGTSLEVDEAWEDAQGIWYKRGGVTHLLERARVRSIERGDAAQKDAGEKTDADGAQAKSTQTKSAQKKSAQAKALVRVFDGEAARETTTLPTVWIYLVGGARMEVDEASETAEGIWYRRGNLSIFIERARIERVEREQPASELAAAETDATATTEKRARRERFWTTGNRRIDALIRQNGAAYGVDPYLVFCVMEHESHFSSGALSPKGARGLMQLMPATAARFGVRNAHDPAQNIRGGTRYLKELMKRFGGRVELVLASYNAGEGTVIRYGQRVPPYRETRNYVRLISARYRRGA